MDSIRWKENLAQRPQLGLCMTYPSPGAIESIGGDWDWIWIDGQHGQLDYRDQIAMVRACNLISRPAVVRVPSHDGGWIGRALDMGPDGLMVPMVDNPDQARQIIRAACFAPLGSRSFGGRRPIDLLGRTYCQDERYRPFLILQIESRSGLKYAEEIASLDGVDALFFGADDYGLEAGLPMEKPKPKEFLDEPLIRIAEAARKHNKVAGAVLMTPELVKQGVELGYRLIVGGADMVMLKTTSASSSQELRKYICG